MTENAPWMQRFGTAFGLGGLTVMVVSLATAAVLTSPQRAAPRSTATGVPGGDAGRAAPLFGQYGCQACHVIPGTTGPHGSVGPSLEHWPDRRFIAGHLANTPDNLVRWLLEPQAIDPTTAMPDMGVTRQDALDMADYLYRLDPGG